MIKELANREQRIRERAYQIWLHVGRPEGRDKIHWDMAAELVAIDDLITLEESQDRNRKHNRIREEYLRYWAKFAIDNAATYARVGSSGVGKSTRPRSLFENSRSRWRLRILDLDPVVDGRRFDTLPSKRPPDR
jgi:ABC-type glutathione transport system ATPase component